MNEIIPFGETWIPDAAREKISEWRVRPGLTPDDHRLIDRLATSPVMRTHVWQRLPATARGAEGVIIEWAFVGARMAAAHRSPPPARPRSVPEASGNHPPALTADAAGVYASMLLDAMRATNVEARLWWTSLWPGDPWVTFEKVGVLLEQLQDFYQSLDETGRRLTKALALPAVRKGSEKAPERFFSRLLTNLFETQFGEPLYPIVATLTAVVFETDEPAKAVTPRGRQKSVPRPAQPRKKSK